MILLSSSVCLLICLSVCCLPVCLHVQLIKQQAKCCFPLLYVFVRTPDLWRSVLWGGIPLWSPNSVWFSLHKCLSWKMKWFVWVHVNATLWIIFHFIQSIFGCLMVTWPNSGLGSVLCWPSGPWRVRVIYLFFHGEQLCVSASVKLQYWPPEVKSHGSIYLYCWQLLQTSLSSICCPGSE